MSNEVNAIIQKYLLDLQKEGGEIPLEHKRNRVGIRVLVKRLVYDPAGEWQLWEACPTTAEYKLGVCPCIEHPVWTVRIINHIEAIQKVRDHVLAMVKDRKQKEHIQQLLENEIKRRGQQATPTTT